MDELFRCLHIFHLVTQNRITTMCSIRFGTNNFQWLDAFLAKSLNCLLCSCHISYDWYGHNLTMWRFHWISLYRFPSFAIELSEWFSYQISKSCVWLLWFAICLLIFGVVAHVLLNVTPNAGMWTVASKSIV